MLYYFERDFVEDYRDKRLPGREFLPYVIGNGAFDLLMNRRVSKFIRGTTLNPVVGTRVAWITYVLLTAQCTGLIVWGVYEWSHYSLTKDFATYYQAMFLISKGDLSPFSSVLQIPIIQQNFELIIWPVALLCKVFPFSLTPLILQDLSLSVACYITLKWVSEVVAVSPSIPVSLRKFVFVFALFFVFSNPWIYWMVSFDIHVESYILPLLLMTGYYIWKGKTLPSSCYALSCVLGGHVGITYLIGLGAGFAIFQRRKRRTSLIVLAIGVFAMVAVEHVFPSGTVDSNLTGLYGYLSPSDKMTSMVQVLIGVLKHPLNAIDSLRYNSKNLISILAPEGVVGVFSSVGLGISAVVLLTTGLIHSHLWSSPQTSMQNASLIPFVIVGTCIWAVKLLQFNRRLGKLFVTLAVCNVLIWFIVWVPQLSGNWVRINNAGVRALAAVQNMIPKSAEVVSTQAFIGRFSNRQWVYSWSSLSTDGSERVVPLNARDVWFLVSPYQGITASSVQQELGRIYSLAQDKNVTLRYHSSDIWAFELKQPSLGGTKILVQENTSVLPAWAMRTDNGNPALQGPISNWHVKSSTESGYVVWGDYTNAVPGQYHLKVKLSANTAVNVEVWNETFKTLVFRRSVVLGSGVQYLHWDFLNPAQEGVNRQVFRGWGPFSVDPVGLYSSALELRIWSSGNGTVDVYNAVIRPNG